MRIFNKKLNLLIFIFIFFFININVFYSQAAFGPLKNYTEIRNQGEKFADQSGFDISTSEDTLANMVAVLIKAFLGLLGVIFIILIIIAGFGWMTAGGDEEKVRKAKSTMQRAIIGLIIVAAAFSITFFVFKALPGGTGTGGASVSSPGPH